MIKLSFRPLSFLLIAVVLVGAGVAFAVQSRSETSVPLSELSRMTHVHGISVDARDSSRLYLATHHGLFAVAPDGTATRISETGDDFMGFTPHPTDSSTFYASGHPARGGNLGFIASTDGGKTWRQLSEGVRGPVDFHQMDVSRANPKTIFGTYGGLQMSRDGGQTWEIAAAQPDGLIDLAASSQDPKTLFAATQTGLLISRDTGQSWQAAHVLRRPTSMVESTANGTLYAFIVGTGLVSTTEASLNWATLNNSFGDRILLHLAADPTNPTKLYAVTHKGEVLASADGGRNWTTFDTAESSARPTGG